MAWFILFIIEVAVVKAVAIWDGFTEKFKFPLFWDTIGADCGVCWYWDWGWYAVCGWYCGLVFWLDKGATGGGLGDGGGCRKGFVLLDLYVNKLE